jgi:hypothetical protein
MWKSGNQKSNGRRGHVGTQSRSGRAGKADKKAFFAGGGSARSRHGNDPVKNVAHGVDPDRNPHGRVWSWSGRPATRGSIFPRTGGAAGGALARRSHGGASRDVREGAEAGFSRLGHREGAGCGDSFCRHSARIRLQLICVGGQRPGDFQSLSIRSFSDRSQRNQLYGPRRP